MDIGVMPLKPDAWSEGKCGFKVIQYLALGIPAVASDVGVNHLIVKQGVSGYLCNTRNDWYEALKQLLQHESSRRNMGREGRKKIVEEYSLQSQRQAFLRLFDDR
jgi:glycosyltransferase involved in cell wall biosynthesis